ncbi:MAG TPA: hypothetical protein VK735_46930, partial [Pseudonocardia sp.]|nr:hypothetical protein [Pseudonocardia sp.]
MAPLTRMRAQPSTFVPNKLAPEYYRQRASTGGLLISEATQVSPTGQGYPNTPSGPTTTAVRPSGAPGSCSRWSPRPSRCGAPAGSASASPRLAPPTTAAGMPIQSPPTYPRSARWPSTAWPT